MRSGRQITRSLATDLLRSQTQTWDEVATKLRFDPAGLLQGTNDDHDSADPGEAGPRFARAFPTVEVDVTASTGKIGHAHRAASVARTGKHEAVELRDRDDPRYDGLSVTRAVAHVNGEIATALLGMTLDDQRAIDARLVELDGTANKGRLGANAILGASLAAVHSAARTAARLYRTLNRYWNEQFAPSPPPTSRPCRSPMVNMISGGLHAGRNLDIQDILIIPLGAASYSDALEMCVGMYRAVGSVLRKRGLESVLVGDEGGYSPKLQATMSMPSRSLSRPSRLVDGYSGRDVAIAVDIASTHFFDPESGRYRLRASGDRDYDRSGLIELLAGWSRKYPIVSIEDGLAEDDWEGWSELQGKLGSTVQIIGDDLFTTQADRLPERN